VILFGTFNLISLENFTILRFGELVANLN